MLRTDQYNMQYDADSENALFYAVFYSGLILAALIGIARHVVKVEPSGSRGIFSVAEEKTLDQEFGLELEVLIVKRRVPNPLFRNLDRPGEEQSL